MKGYVVCVYKSISNEEKLKEYRLELEKKVMVEDFKMPAQSNGASMIHNTALSPKEN